MTLKIFQTRIYAQAFTIAALCGAAAITVTEDADRKARVWLCRRLTNESKTSHVTRQGMLFLFVRPCSQFLHVSQAWKGGCG
jgi:hypothetical protein